MHICDCVCLLCLSSLAFGNCNGLAVVDYLQKTILLCMSTLDLYGAADPYQRLTRSPRRNRQSTSGSTHTSGILPHTCASTQKRCQRDHHADSFISLSQLFSTPLSTFSLFLFFFFTSTGVSFSFSPVSLLWSSTSL